MQGSLWLIWVKALNKCSKSCKNKISFATKVTKGNEGGTKEFLVSPSFPFVTLVVNEILSVSFVSLRDLSGSEIQNL
jgi:hypothetical protein